MPAAFRFCGHCGNALAHACPGCGAGMPAEYRYCGLCGVALRQPGADGLSPPNAPALPEGRPSARPRQLPARRAETPEPLGEQRRRVAILFADLSGSTAMSDRLEVETSYRLVSECVTGLGRIVSEAGGYVVKTLGDGLMALFGAPLAHGDDAARAARAGLWMQAWMERRGRSVEERYGVRLRLRVGINYGSVVAAPITAGDRPQYDVLGDAVNVAQRLEAAAEPGTVIVSEAFYRITRGEFQYLDLGTAQVKGKPEPLRLFRLAGELPAAERRAVESAFPLAGRDAELSRLLAAVQHLQQGHSTLLGITGEGGLGKSRLLEELSGELVSRGLPLLVAAGTEAGRTTPLGLWRTWLANLLSLPEGTDYAQGCAALAETLEGTPAEATAEWLAAVVTDPQRLLTLPVEARDALLLDTLRSFLRYWSGERAAALLVDEAGLVDSLSRELLVRLARGEEGLPAPPVLVVLAGRSSESFPPPEAQSIALGPLSVAEVNAWVREALPGREVPERVLAALAERSGGSPLYLDMILRAAREAPDPLTVLSAVPDTVYGVVQSQLDALSPEERRVAQVAAILGRTFPEAWLDRLLSPTGPGSLPPASPVSAYAPWTPLEARGMLVERKARPNRELAFRHGALQEVLYEGMLRRERREKHIVAAEIAAAAAGEHPDLAWIAARHWQGAEDWERALSWTLKAAVHAAAVYAGPEAEELYLQCRNLAQRLCRPVEEARALRGLAEVAMHRGDFAAALGHYEQARCLFAELPPEEGETADSRLLRATLGLGEARVLARTGEASRALPLLERALALLADPGPEEARRLRVECLIEQSLDYSDLGLLREAVTSGREALRAVEREGWTKEEAAANSALGLIYPLLDDWPEAERHLRRALELAEAEHDWKGAAAAWSNLGAGLQSAGRLPEAVSAFEKACAYARRIADVEKLAIVRMNLGTVYLNHGDWAAAAASFRESLEPFRKMGHALGEAASLYNLADALRWGGEPEAAEQVLREAEQKCETVDAPHLQVHIRAARAEVELLRSDLDGALQHAQRALGLATETDYEGGVRLARLALGRVLRKRGDLAAAEAELRASMDSYANAGEPLEAARARAELAAVRAAIGDGSTARDLHAKACAMIRTLNAAPWLPHLPPMAGDESADDAAPRPAWDGKDREPAVRP